MVDPWTTTLTDTRLGGLPADCLVGLGVLTDLVPIPVDFVLGDGLSCRLFGL